MDLTRSSHAAAGKPAQAIPAEKARSIHGHAGGSPIQGAVHAGYGLPCAHCHLYYPADLDACPGCQAKERVAPDAKPAFAKPVLEPIPDSVIEKEREAFLKEFQSQLYAAHANVAGAPVECSLGDHGVNAEPATICKQCYERMQERVDVFDAALHIDLKEAAQIVYDAVWADPSDPSKTYANAASALLGELRKRAGVSAVLGPFQPLGN